MQAEAREGTRGDNSRSSERDWNARAALRKSFARENGSDSLTAFEVKAVSVSTSVVLVCAILCSLVVGVLVAYALCVTMFHLFRAHSHQRSARRIRGFTQPQI